MQALRQAKEVDAVVALRADAPRAASGCAESSDGRRLPRPSSRRSARVFSIFVRLDFIGPFGPVRIVPRLSRSISGMKSTTCQPAETSQIGRTLPFRSRPGTDGLAPSPHLSAIKPATLVAVIVFFPVALLHLLRVVLQLDVLVAGTVMPKWLSGVGFPPTAGLAVALWREARSGGPTERLSVRTMEQRRESTGISSSPWTCRS